MANYELCEPFGIDDGELDGLSPTKCFVLGVEWQQVRKLVGDYLSGEIPGFAKPVHGMNRERMEAMIQRHNVPGSVTIMNDDWDWISVGVPPCLDTPGGPAAGKEG